MAKDAILYGNAVKICLFVVLLSHGFQQYKIALAGFATMMIRVKA